MTDYEIQRLGNTTFALRPDYDAVVAELGGEPPLGLPIECTFEWAMDLAQQKVNRENRLAEAKTRAVKRKNAAVVVDTEDSSVVAVVTETTTIRKPTARKASPRKVTRKAAPRSE